ncbi:MAG: M81 family metallopeptidase [Lachnospiraceae bacterium]|nr:M81 family metallopeptidase [Lachnospiraceae bacterium]
MKSKARILVLEFSQESNTFNPIPAGIETFRADRVNEGKTLYDAVKKLRNALHGIIDAVEAAGGEVIMGPSISAGSSGVVTDEVFDLMRRKTEQYFTAEGPFDGVFFSMHGATVAESHHDACGDLLEFARSLAGPGTVLTASFDLHANLTDKVLSNADAVSTYQTYPHLDFYETGRRSAELGLRILAGKPTYTASVLMPLLIPPSGYTSLKSPFKEVIDYGKDLIQNGVLLDFSVTAVQPWLDIEKIASAAVAVADNEETAKHCAEELAKRFFKVKDECWPVMMSVDEIIDLAEKEDTPKPVVLADAADSPNGGAVGDSVTEALRIYERGSAIRAGLFVKDPEAVKQAFEVGVGNRAVFEIGGKFTPGADGPLRAEGLVKTLSDGEFMMEGPAGRGAVRWVGKAAVIRIGNMDIMVCERPVSSGDPQLFRHFGIEPTLLDLIVVKANTSFLVPYGKFAGTICYADTPGAGAPNLRRLVFKNLPKNFYPFDLDPEYRPEAARIRRIR